MKLFAMNSEFCMESHQKNPKCLAYTLGLANKVYSLVKKQKLASELCYPTLISNWSLVAWETEWLVWFIKISGVWGQSFYCVSVTLGLVAGRIFYVFVLPNQLSLFPFITFLVNLICFCLHDVCQMPFCKE